MRQPWRPLEELLKELSPDCQQEVRDFIEFLLEKRGRKVGGTLRQDWAGTLRDYRDRYTSLELQKKHWNGAGTDLVYLVDTDFNRTERGSRTPAATLEA